MKVAIWKFGALLFATCCVTACDDPNANRGFATGGTYPSVTGGAGAAAPASTGGISGMSGVLATGGNPGDGGTQSTGGILNSGGTLSSEGADSAISMGTIDASTVDGGGSTVTPGTGGTTDVGGSGGTTANPVTPVGPDDGDPNAPIVSTPDVACGGPTGMFGLGSPNFQLDSRDMIVTYPCNKHAGAPMIFFMNLHGTTPVEAHFYQHGYFSVHKYTESHNIIVVTPSSVVEQWGNGDNGEDAPHLMHIIDWVYTTFNGDGKFDIRAMWVGGHSWGAMYTTSAVCNPDVADKIKGAVIMSGMGLNPRCANVLSVISTAAEDDIGPVVNQGTVPASHGCDAEQTNTIGNNEETLWPNCDPGFVHANYFMLGKTHTSPIDDVVVERIADLMVQARQ